MPWVRGDGVVIPLALKLVGVIETGYPGSGSKSEERAGRSVGYELSAQHVGVERILELSIERERPADVRAVRYQPAAARNECGKLRLYVNISQGSGPANVWPRMASAR